MEEFTKQRLLLYMYDMLKPYIELELNLSKKDPRRKKNELILHTILLVLIDQCRIINNIQTQL